MTTLTIEIPDSKKALIEVISDLLSKEGVDTLTIETDDDSLSEAELESLKKGYREALLIKSGKLKAIPLSELWND